MPYRGPTSAFIAQRRTFASFSSLLRQKSIVNKIRAAPGSRNDLSFTESASYYWKWLITPTRKLLDTYENQLVATLTLPRGVSLERGTVAGLHELHLKSESARDIETPTLLVHGHAASAILYHRNFEALSGSIKNLYAIDFPDTGLSDRRPLKVSPVKQKLELVKTNREEDDSTILSYRLTQNKEKNLEQVQKVENYYVEAIDQWRQEHGFEKINLVSHSFGALISFRYALTHPHRVSKLVLCSPAGVERNIFSLNNTESSGKLSDNPASPRYYRPAFVPRIIALLGFGVTKSLGPFGVQLISKYLSMRYSRGSQHDEQVKILVRYTIALFHQRNNSYRNLKVLLTNQILGVNPILDSATQLQVPTSIIYGSFDWMNSQAGYEMYKEIEKVGKIPAWFSVVNNAGHNVFLDNHEEYDKQVLAFLKETKAEKA